MILPSSTVLLLFTVTILSSSSTINAWLTVTEKNNGNQRSRYLSAHINDNNERYHRGEVIGATGKIGSYLLDAINSPVVTRTDGQSTIYPQCQPVAATPRGVAPGCLSLDDTPIYACIPSSSIASVWDATVPHRRKDLVFLCNCIPSRHLNFGDGDFTICIIHFGVTHHKMNSASSQPLPLLNTSPMSPPTVIFGRHATTLSDILRRDGISVEIAPTSQHLQMAAAKKLAWSSLFWLLCHDGKEPITVKVVWERKLEQIHELVKEMMPALKSLANESWMNNDTDMPSKKEFSTVEEFVDYLYRYSYSMKDGKVTPSLDLALDEISERNGVLLSTMLKLQSDAKDRSSKQLELVRRVAGEENLRRCLDTPDKRTCNDHDSIVSPERVSCIASDLQFLFSSTSKFVNDDFKNSEPSVVIIGAGIIGSSLAYHLSRLGDVQVTVLDKSTNLLPREAKGDNDKDGNNDGFSPGVATSSSFAWLNANDKSPLSYMQLNHLGMEMWRRHDCLKEFPVWCGALLRKPKQSIEEDRSSAYVCVGPLNCSDANDLEPGIQMGVNESDESSEFYFYPEEGYVEPSNVVKALRGSGRRNGVHFIGGSEVVSLIRNNSGSVVGVEYTTSNASAIHRVEANVVVAASGASFAVASLVGAKRLPLSHQPGALAYINSDSVSNYAHPLSRIYVDTIKQTHILRRPNGTLVIGGGKLITGGTTGTNDSTGNEEFDTSMTDTTKDTAIGIEMISAALSAPPLELTSLANSSRNENGFRVTKANRPISTDGLPVVGFSERGLYVAVTHSGITLAPLIGELASYEIRASLGAQRKEPSSTNQEMYGFQILDAYRPSRFS
ncbi:hypothetical protein ACHAWC_008531 [Mediolabrus comicus]